MSVYRDYQNNTDKEVNGVPVEFGANDDGTIPIFQLSRIGETNKEFSKALRLATKPYQRLIALKQLSPEKDREIYMSVFIATILKGWSNVQDNENQILPFTKENAVKLFTDLPDLYDELLKSAQDAALFRKFTLEDQVKN